MKASSVSLWKELDIRDLPVVVGKRFGSSSNGKNKKLGEILRKHVCKTSSPKNAGLNKYSTHTTK